MAGCQLTHTDVMRLFDYNPKTGVLSWKPRHSDAAKTPGEKSWDKRFSGKPVGAHHNGYVRFSICWGHHRQQYLVHRVVWLMHHGKWPDVIDHIDGNRSNNRLENLRSVTKPENSLNRRLAISNKSGVTGVHWCKRARKWTACIRKSRKLKHLGYFENIHDAENARIIALADNGFHRNHGTRSCDGNPSKAD